HVVLIQALKKVIEEGIIHVSDKEQEQLSIDWTGRFRWINVGAQFAGISAGVSVALANYILYTNPKMGYWILDDQGHVLLVAGFMYLFGLFLFYAIAMAYAVRICAIPLFFRAIVKVAKVNTLPLHPDKAGGLSPIGHLGLRNQYVLMLIGLNFV